MFTGIIEEVGTVQKIEMSGSGTSAFARLFICAKKVLENTQLGDSIAVNGVCLTVTSIEGTIFTADVMAETMRRTSLGGLASGGRVNLERAMAADGRFGGHIVSGHIDGTGTVQKMMREGNATWVYIDAPKNIMRLVVQKGSVALDGISLTVAAVSEAGFAVSIIPHTGEETTLLQKKAGDAINIENDIIGKYVERLLGIQQENGGDHASKITEEFLHEHGF